MTLDCKTAMTTVFARTLCLFKLTLVIRKLASTQFNDQLRPTSNEDPVQYSTLD